MDQKRKKAIAGKLDDIGESLLAAQEALEKEDEDEVENQIDLASEWLLGALVLAEERT